MKGIIEDEFHHKINGGIVSVFICGEDGVTYHGHHTEFVRKTKHYRKGRTVTFEIGSLERAHPEAIKIDVEIPQRPEKDQDKMVCLKHLPDGAYVKRVERPNGELHSYIIKDDKLIIHALTEYERDIIWIYLRGASGYDEIGRGKES